MALRLSCNSIVLACSLPGNTNNRNNSLSPPQSNPATTTPPTTKTKTVQRRLGDEDNRIQKQLKLIHFERTIGAGSYRDNEPKDADQRNSILKGLVPNFDGSVEGPAERKLRETGEWINSKTEGQFRSSGKSILMFSFKWVLPIYFIALLVAAGVVKLPFSTPFLDDLLM